MYKMASRSITPLALGASCLVLDFGVSLLLILGIHVWFLDKCYDYFQFFAILVNALCIHVWVYRRGRHSCSHFQ